MTQTQTGSKTSEDTDVVCGDTYLDRDEAWLEWRFDADRMLTVLAPELLDEVIRLREETGLLSPDLPEPEEAWAGTEYRVIHKTPGAMGPATVPSKRFAEDYIRTAEKYFSIGSDLKIQSRTVTEWEDV